MCILTLTQQGLSVKRESKRLLVTLDEKFITELQVKRITGLLLMGNISITVPALTALADEGIITAMLSLDGRIKGLFLPPASKNLDLRFLQYKSYQNPTASIKIAKHFLDNKLAAYSDFYRAKQKNVPIPGISKFLSKIEDYRKDVKNTQSIDSVLGYEGIVSKEHFQFYGELFTSELQFRKRSKHPATDPVNALLNLGYAMLYKLLFGMTYAAGLDPYVGFLHSEDYNRASLACDFQEFYRTMIVDNYVLKLCNKKMVRLEHFTQNQETGEYRLTTEGMETFLSGWRQILVGSANDCLVWLVNERIKQFIALVRASASANEVMPWEENYVCNSV